MKLLDFIKQNAEKVKEKLTEEQAQAVSKALEELGYNVLVDDTKSPNYFPKSRYDEVNARKKELEKQIKDLQKVVDEYNDLKPQLESMKAAAGENSNLKKQLEELQQKISEYPKKIEELQKQNEEWEAKYKETTINSAIKMAAINAKANDPEDILKYVDKEKLELTDDGTVKGLDEQLKDLTERKPYLFGFSNPEGTGGSPGGGAKPKPKDKQSSLSDFMKAIYENQAKRN